MNDKPRTFIIDYTVYYYGKSEQHTTKVKGCTEGLFAKLKLEKWLKGKYVGFDRLVISKCSPENPLAGLFGGGFGNPFNF